MCAGGNLPGQASVQAVQTCTVDASQLSPHLPSMTSAQPVSYILPAATIGSAHLTQLRPSQVFLLCTLSRIALALSASTSNACMGMPGCMQHSLTAQHDLHSILLGTLHLNLDSGRSACLPSATGSTSQDLPAWFRARCTTPQTVNLVALLPYQLASFKPLCRGALWHSD